MNTKQIISCFLILFYSGFLFSQSIVEYVIIEDCGNNCIGSLTISIDSSQLEPDWQFPFSVDYEHDLTGDGDYIEFNSYSITIDALCSGVYELDIAFSETCGFVDDVVVGEKSGMEIIETVACICTPDGYGEIELDVLGHSDPYTFQWSGPNNFNSNDQSLYGLTNNGDYFVTVTDVNGCTLVDNFRVDNCSFEFASFNEEVQNACNGPGTGSIDVTIPLQTLNLRPPIDFFWVRTDGGPQPSANQITTDVIAGSSRIEYLDAGEYCLVIATQNGCETQKCWTIEEYESPDLQYEITPESNGNDGEVILILDWNTPPLTYAWSNGATTKEINNLCAGDYTVTISRAGTSCQIERTYTVGGTNQGQ